ncbi:hypothetical protein ABT282_07385 [Streptomyces sp. NPDC000927]|uniref:hypothetical protein n=1 Tax=Streptomyces sp. NPDC000927 TaxID=3154371 RepID=UPI00331DC8F4
MTSEITEADAGTWLDGAHGWTNGYRAVERAIELGWSIPEEYQEGWAAFQLNYGDHDAWCEANGDDGGFVDAATEYLQSIAPDGYVFRWDDGLSLIRDYMDCATDGNGCEVTGYDKRGNDIVKLCPDHNPCEGRYGEDYQLLSGSDGTEYCDGSCVKR